MMPILLIVLSACGFFAVMVGVSKLADRTKAKPVAKDARTINFQGIDDAGKLTRQKAELEARVKALASKEASLIASMQEFEQGTDARKGAKLAAEQDEINAAIAARSAVEARVHQLRESERKLADAVSDLQDEADRRKAQVDDLSADVADLTRTKDALDESITTLLSRQREIEADMAELDRDIDERRRERVAEMEAAVAAQKELALSKIMAWTESEKSRLQERFESSYQSEVTDLRRQLIEKVTAEFDSIHEYFSAFASERKLMAETEIKEFLAEKRSTILSNLE
jgi:chromosome segregation ATPase